MRWLVAALVVLWLGALEAQAQACLPAVSCTATVRFEPTAEGFAARRNCLGPNCIAAVGTTGLLEFTIDHPNAGNANELHVSVAGLSGYELVAEHLVMRGGGSGCVAPTRSGWGDVQRTNTLLYRCAAPRVDVTMQYQLRPTASVAPSTRQTATVSFRWGSANGAVVATHAIDVVPPSVLQLRIDGVPQGQTASVGFELPGSDLAAYIQAVSNGTLFRPSNVNFQRVELVTTHPRGATVTATLVLESGVATETSLTAGRFRLAGQPIANWSFSTSTASPVPVTVVRGDQYGLIVDGGEAPGTYVFRLTFTAQPNP